MFCLGAPPSPLYFYMAKTFWLWGQSNLRYCTNLCTSPCVWMERSYLILTWGLIRSVEHFCWLQWACVPQRYKNGRGWETQKHRKNKTEQGCVSRRSGIRIIHKILDKKEWNGERKKSLFKENMLLCLEDKMFSSLLSITDKRQDRSHHIEWMMSRLIITAPGAQGNIKSKGMHHVWYVQKSIPIHCAS